MNTGIEARIILASTDQNDWILDPFSGSSTTGIAANLCGRKFAGIELDEQFCQMSKARREELDNLELRANIQRHIVDLKQRCNDNASSFVCEPFNEQYGNLPFEY